MAAALLTSGGVANALTVEEAVSAGCSTSQLEALSVQIIAQGNCITPGAFVELSQAPNVNFGSAVLPYMEEPARDALAEALAANAATSMQINSMLRTVAQQYLLYRWSQLGTCGIGLAATPGNSNHETGLAIDIQQYDTWRPILEAKGFSWLGANDPVHFDYVGPGAIDHRGTDVLAFQQLWNLNHPEEIIDEDGDYGPQTEGVLLRAPAEGFPIGPTCGEVEPGDPDVRIEASFDAGDPYDDGVSAGAFDLILDRMHTLDVEVFNDGDASLDASTMTVVYPGEYLLTDQNSVELDVIAAGDSQRLTIDFDTLAYSVDRAATLPVMLAIDDVETTLKVDIYSDRQWTFDGGRREGWSDGEVLDGALVFETSSDSPLLQISAEAVRIVASATGPASIAFGDGAAQPLDIPNDGATHEVVVATSDIAQIQLIGSMTVDEIELTGGTLGPLPEESEDGVTGGCSCSALGHSPSQEPWQAIVLLFSAVWLRRGRRG